MSAAPKLELGDVMATKSGSVEPSKFPDEVFDLYSIPAFDLGQPEVVAGTNIGSTKQIVEPGDVLLSKIVPHIRRSWVVGAHRGRRIIASGEWIVFRSERLHPGYMRHVLVGDPFHAQFMQTVSGVGGSLLRARPSHVAKISVPLPPLSEQRRIAEILDKADALRAKRRAALDQLDTLTQSIFVDMFGDPATNPRRLPCLPLREAADIATGGTPSRDVDGFFGGDIPWVKTTEVRGESIHDTEEKLTESGLRAIRGKLHPASSVVIAMYGQGKTRGQSGLLAIDAAVNQACAVVHPSPNFDSRFMLTQLRLGYERLRAMGRGGNQENLNLDLVGSFRVLVPSMAHQTAFVARLEAIENIKTSAKHSLAELDALFASLQHRAFRGEL